MISSRPEAVMVKLIISIRGAPGMLLFICSYLVSPCLQKFGLPDTCHTKPVPDAICNFTNKVSPLGTLIVFCLSPDKVMEIIVSGFIALQLEKAKNPMINKAVIDFI